MDKNKVYTFGIKDKRNVWNFLDGKHKLYPFQMREAYFADKKTIEECANYILKHISDEDYLMDTANLFEITIDTIPFKNNVIEKV